MGGQTPQLSVGCAPELTLDLVEAPNPWRVAKSRRLVGWQVSYFAQPLQVEIKYPGPEVCTI